METETKVSDSSIPSVKCDCDYEKAWKEALESGNDFWIAVEFLHKLNYHSSEDETKDL